MVDFDPNAMGGRIKTIREKHNMTQQQVADLLRMSRETYNTIENGRRSLKDFELLSLANILETSCDFILGGIESKNIDICKALHLDNETVEILKENARHIDKLTQKNISDDDADIGKEYLFENTALQTMIKNAHGRSYLRILYGYLFADFSFPFIIKDQDNFDPETVAVEREIQHFLKKKINSNLPLSFMHLHDPSITIRVPSECVENGYLLTLQAKLVEMKKSLAHLLTFKHQIIKEVKE